MLRDLRRYWLRGVGLAHRLWQPLRALGPNEGNWVGGRPRGGCKCDKVAGQRSQAYRHLKNVALEGDHFSQG